MTKSVALDWEVTLWPNRSLSRDGFRYVMVVLAACFAIFLMMAFFAPGYEVARSAQIRVFSIILLIMLGTLAIVWLAFRRNNQDGEYRERLAIADGKLIIEALHPRRPLKRWEFPSYWTRVTLRSTRHVENQVVLQHQGKAVAIGAFLTPEERADLAEEIERALLRDRMGPV